MNYEKCPFFSAEDTTPWHSDVFDHPDYTYYCTKSGKKKEIHPFGCSRCKEMKRMTVMERLQAHYEEALQYFPADRIVGIFLQGSQNYGLEVPGSDVDTKLIVTPTFEEIAFNKKPHSTTHLRANQEHIDFKDIRLYMQTFRKQNLNFLEILFTDYKIINPLYEKEWQRLVDAREAIAHMNPYRAVQSMKGIALEKFHAMEHPYPSKLDIIQEYGYDHKQLHHLRRVDDYLERYIAGESYESCLRPTDPESLRWEKMHFRPLEEARSIALAAKEHVEQMAQDFYTYTPNQENAEVSDLLDSVQYNIMEIAIKKEFE